MVHVENQFSMTPRWLIPFLKGATCVWAYDRGLPAQRLTAENNGSRVTLEEAEHVQRLAFPALEALAEHPGLCISALTVPLMPCPSLSFLTWQGA